MLDKKFSSKELKLIFPILLIITLVVVLGIWTSHIYENRRKEELRSALESVISERGEKGLFDLAGIPSESMNYGPVDLYLGERGAWTFQDNELSDIAAYDKAKVSTVQIIGSTSLRDESQASGVIISSDGYIVTNKHVLSSGDSISVNFYDGTSADALVIGSDSLTDLAVIKTDRTDLEPISFSSHDPVIGSRAIAIGNPYGYTWSMSAGVVSGLGRSLFTPDGMITPNLIQTDNFINPGNSGGPLLDSRGDMIGLISSIYSTSGSAQGISFAIPSSTVKRISGEIIGNGSVSRGMVDAVLLELNPQIVSYLGLPISSGLMVSEVVDGGSAEKAGLRGGREMAQYGDAIVYLGGDVIVEMDGNPIESYSDYFLSLFGTQSGDEVEITVFRDGKMIVLDTELVEQNDENMRWILQ